MARGAHPSADRTSHFVGYVASLVRVFPAPMLVLADEEVAFLAFKAVSNMTFRDVMLLALRTDSKKLWRK